MTQVKFEHRFDPQRNRHYINEELTVLHCHHYASLFTQLAFDAKDIVDGTKILMETAEDVFMDVLKKAFALSQIKDMAGRIQAASQFFSKMGMGTMTPLSVTEKGGEVALPHAYLDEGWLKKWGQHSGPVNLIGAGFIAGMFSVVFNKPTRSFQVTETQSVVSGADKSVFKITT